MKRWTFYRALERFLRNNREGSYMSMGLPAIRTRRIRRYIDN